MKNIIFIRYLSLSIILLLLIISAAILLNFKSSDNIISLTNNWQYRVGDSPVDEDGFFIWLDDDLNVEEWTSVNHFSDIPRKGCKSIWVRTILPDTTISNPILHVGGILEIVQVFINGEQIYQSGDFSDINSDHFLGWYEPLIELPANTSQNILYFRIWSGQGAIGLSWPVHLGSEHMILKYLFEHNVDEFFLAPIFIFLSIVLLLVILFLKLDKLLFGIAIFLLGIGIFIGSNTDILQALFFKPKLFLIFDFFSLLIFTIGGLIVVEQIVSDEYKIIAKRIINIYLVFLPVSLIPILLLITSIVNILYGLFFLLICIVPIFVFYILSKSIKKGNKGTKIYFIGLAIFTLSALIEVIFHVMRHLHNTFVTNLNPFHIQFIHIGALGLVVALAFVVVNKYHENYQQKENALKQVLESEKYRELDKLKSQFFANISHEFRTPLTLILGTAKQIIKHGTNEIVKSKSRLQIKNGQRLLNLVNELLELSKIDAGMMKLKIQYSDIMKQIKEMYNQFESYAESKNIKMEMISDLDEAFLYYDPEKIDKVLFNLISNALKYTPSGGKVSIFVAKNDTLTIKISDTGSGISEEHLSHIFDRFYQADNNNIQEQQGSGIGLALANELINLHHGQISVESKIDVGSSFTVQLQLGLEHFSKEELVHSKTMESVNKLKDTLTKEDESELRQNKQHQLTKKHLPTVLIVEDNKDLRNYIHEELNAKYQLLEAENGEIGFDLAISQIPDLIISDVMMPVMNGFQLCEKLKTDERTSHIPIILLTARSDSNSKIDGLSLGADDYLTKPFESNELKIRIHNLIEQRQKLRQKFSKEITIPLSEISVMPADEQFLQRITDIVLSNLGNSNLNIDWLCGQAGLSRSQLHRKIKALTDQSSSEFVRSIRLKQAIQLLQSRSATISEIAYKTGFANPDYFRRCFKKQFGVPPSEYLSSK